MGKWIKRCEGDGYEILSVTTMIGGMGALYLDQLCLGLLMIAAATIVHEDLHP